AAPVYVPSTPSYPSPTYGASGSPDHVLVPNPTGRLETPPPNAALIRLSVPDPFAEVWFNGAKTTSSGTSRYYVTPELGGERHHSEVTAPCPRNGQAVTQTRQIAASPGKTAVVEFSKPG